MALFVILKEIEKHMKLRKVVYTVITGKYDNLRSQPRIKGWDYICFTDDPELKSEFWDICQVPADDELDEEDIITDEDLMDDEESILGDVVFAESAMTGAPPANNTAAPANQQTEDEASASASVSASAAVSESASVSTSTSNSIDSHISSMKTRYLSSLNI